MTAAARPDDILAAEQRRCDALIRRDLAALGNLLADDLVHIHTNGQAETKTQYLESIAGTIEFLSIDRLDADVCIVGDLAVLRGRVNQLIRVAGHDGDIPLPIYATIVWRNAGGWRVFSFQATLTP